MFTANVSPILPSQGAPRYGGSGHSHRQLYSTIKVCSYHKLTWIFRVEVPAGDEGRTHQAGGHTHQDTPVGQVDEVFGPVFGSDADHDRVGDDGGEKDGQS